MERQLTALLRTTCQQQVKHRLEPQVSSCFFIASLAGIVLLQAFCTGNLSRKYIIAIAISSASSGVIACLLVVWLVVRCSNSLTNKSLQGEREGQQENGDDVVEIDLSNGNGLSQLTTGDSDRNTTDGGSALQESVAYNVVLQQERN